MLYFLQNGEVNAVYNADEMGLGKSIQTIVTLENLGTAKWLVLCPKSMVLTWAKEINKWQVSPRTINVVQTADQVRRAKECNITIMNYERITDPSTLKFLVGVPWCALVCDEAHKLKNYSAKRTRAVFKYLFPVSRYKILLSGTPFLRDITDGFSPFKALAPSVFPDFFAFANRYSLSIETNWGTKYFGIQNPEELKNIIRSRFYIRRTKEEVGLQLPPKEWIKVPLPAEYCVTLPKDQKEAAEREAAVLKHAIETGEDTSHEVPKNLMALRKLQGLKKVKPIADFARELLEQEIPIVIFAYHKDVIDGLAKELSDFNPYTLTGDTSGSERERAITSFQNGDGLCFIANLIAGGVGVTLTKASVCLICEYTFSPADISQAIGRIDRIGQQNNMFIYYFAVRGSIDQELIEVIMDKAKNFAQIVEN